MNIPITNTITVDIHVTPKKKKKNKSKYDIYMTFSIYNNGLLQSPPCISTGITVDADKWQNERVKGKTQDATIINERLQSYLFKSKELLETLRIKGCKSCSEIRHEILTTIKTSITGKAPKGQKNIYLSRLQEYELNVLIQAYVQDHRVTEKRRKKFERGLKLLEEFFSNEGRSMPIISDFDIEDLEKFKIWYFNQYIKSGRHKKNTTATYLTALSTIFNFAVKRKIIAATPIPTNFSNGWEKGERQILEEDEILRLMNYNDGLRANEIELSETDKVAKYCMLMQCLTGMGYGDLKKIRLEHIQYKNGAVIIEKKREKTNVKFTVVLTANAKHIFDKLRLLRWMENPRKLTPLRQMKLTPSRHFKLTP